MTCFLAIIYLGLVSNQTSTHCIKKIGIVIVTGLLDAQGDDTTRQVTTFIISILNKHIGTDKVIAAGNCASAKFIYVLHSMARQ